jgi:hypothetical protein
MHRSGFSAVLSYTANPMEEWGDQQRRRTPDIIARATQTRFARMNRLSCHG